MAKRRSQQDLFDIFTRGDPRDAYKADGAYDDTSRGVKRKLFDDEEREDWWLTHGSASTSSHTSQTETRGKKSKGTSYGKLLPPLKPKELKTSITHPIRVDVFPKEALPLPGKLGMTISPGKKQTFGWSAHHDRDLKLDLTTLRKKFGINTLVSLIEESELKELKTPHLLKAADDSGIGPIWYPIPDMSAPSDFVTSMELIEELYDQLESGRNIAIHCKGGLGRTGCIAACLLVRVGHDPKNAIRWTRHVRKGTIQTKVQEYFIYAYAWEIGSMVRP